MSGLAEQQAALVRALVARGQVPCGLDPERVDVALRALLRKRADDVARAWPVLMADPATRRRFLDWADGRPRTTSFDEGLAFALEQQELSPAARDELRRHRPRRFRPRVRRPRCFRPRKRRR